MSRKVITSYAGDARGCTAESREVAGVDGEVDRSIQ